jgi:hypothetical protein
MALAVIATTGCWQTRSVESRRSPRSRPAPASCSPSHEVGTGGREEPDGFLAVRRHVHVAAEARNEPRANSSFTGLSSASTTRRRAPSAPADRSGTLGLDTAAMRATSWLQLAGLSPVPPCFRGGGVLPRTNAGRCGNVAPPESRSHCPEPPTDRWARNIPAIGSAGTNLRAGTRGQLRRAASRTPGRPAQPAPRSTAVRRRSRVSAERWPGT